MTLRIADIIEETIVDGSGLRFSVYVQGCYHNCPGCHNTATHDPEGGRVMEVKEIFDLIKKNPLLDGITISGGEPFLQAEPLCELAKLIKGSGLNIYIYSGYTFEELLAMPNNKKALELLSYADVLVDGRFEAGLKDYELLFRGSSNQRLINIQESLRLGKATTIE